MDAFFGAGDGLFDPEEGDVEREDEEALPEVEPLRPDREELPDEELPRDPEPEDPPMMLIPGASDAQGGCTAGPHNNREQLVQGI